MKYIFVLCAMFCAAVAQIMLKKSSGFNAHEFAFWKWFVFACFLFVAATFSNIFVMRSFPVSKTTAVVSIGTIILVYVGGILLFHEPINIKQCIGLVLGSASIFLIITHLTQNEGMR